MTRHTITHADEMYHGDAFFSRYSPDGRRGVQMSHIYKGTFGAPAAIVAGALVASATGAELPNNATIAYTTATDGTSPLDSASRPAVSSVVMADGVAKSVWTLDKPRNVTLNVTHGSSIVAITLLVSGYDQYGQAMSELLSISATGTTKTANGKKAFKYIESYSFVSAGNATTDTAIVSWGDVFGLPFRVTTRSDVIGMNNGVPDATQTVVVGDDTTATTTTGDPRGTIDYTDASDGTKTFGYWLALPDVSTKEAAFGVTPA